MQIKLSYSRINEFATCPRFFQYSNELQLEPDRESLGMKFGDAGHRGLGALYTHNSLDACLTVASDAWKPFEGMDVEKNGQPGMRTTAKLREILTAYFEQLYGKEEWIDQGGERLESMVLKRGELEIIYRFKIDREGLSGGVPAIQEWKFNKPFFTNEFIPEPNLQIVGYLRATGKKKAVVTVCDVVKNSVKGQVQPRNKADLPRSIFHRDPVYYDDWVFKEWEEDVFGWAVSILTCRESNYWPKNAPGACGNYGGCVYKTLCNAEEEQRKVLMELSFRKKEKREVGE